MRPACKTSLIFLIFIGCFFASVREAQAIFTFSVTPRRGGQDLRFEAAEPGGILRNEEVTFTVTSDRAAQYMISQAVYQPLTNEFGNTIPQGAFVMFSPSKPLGTLRAQLETPLIMGQTSLFTSNTAGDSDSFLLVFNVRVPEEQPGGTYHTQITYTAEPINPQSGMSLVITHMDVRVEIRPTFRIIVQGVRGGRSLDLGRISKDRQQGSQTLKMDIESNIGTTYRIVQQMTEPLTSQEGEVTDEGDFKFIALGGTHGILTGGGSPVEISTSPALLYTSHESGQGDTLQIQYILTPPSEQKAGIYSGNLSFKVESNSAFVTPDVINVPVRIEIEPLFYLDLEAEQGSNLHFGTFRTGQEKQERRILLSVHSNLGTPYQVSQIISRKLTNEEGAAIPKDRFTFFGSEAQTGILAIMSPTPVPEGEAVVFTSDNNGTPEKFVLSYALTIPQEARGGSYSSEVLYSITTL